MINDTFTKAESIQSQDRSMSFSPSHNVYENTVLIAKRAKQVLARMRTSFSSELEDIEDIDNYIESAINNRKQQLLSKKYEKMPKPVVVAIKDSAERNIMYSYPNKN